MQESVADQETALDLIEVSDSEPEPEPDLNELPASIDAEKQGLTEQEHVLQNHREAQESISDDLLQMAQSLRQNQVMFSEAILKDTQLIEKTGEALQINATKMKSAGTRLREYTRKSSSMCWLSVGAVLVAFVSFFIMIGIIKVT